MSNDDNNVFIYIKMPFIENGDSSGDSSCWKISINSDSSPVSSTQGVPGGGYFIFEGKKYCFKRSGIAAFPNRGEVSLLVAQNNLGTDNMTLPLCLEKIRSRWNAWTDSLTEENAPTMKSICGWAKKELKPYLLTGNKRKSENIKDEESGKGEDEDKTEKVIYDVSYQIINKILLKDKAILFVETDEDKKAAIIFEVLKLLPRNLSKKITFNTKTREGDIRDYSLNFVIKDTLSNIKNNSNYDGCIIDSNYDSNSDDCDYVKWLKTLTFDRGYRFPEPSDWNNALGLEGGESDVSFDKISDSVKLNEVAGGVVIVGKFINGGKLSDFINCIKVKDTLTTEQQKKVYKEFWDKLRKGEIRIDDQEQLKAENFADVINNAPSDGGYKVEATGITKDYLLLLYKVYDEIIKGTGAYLISEGLWAFLMGEQKEYDYSLARDSFVGFFKSIIDTASTETGYNQLVEILNECKLSDPLRDAFADEVRNSELEKLKPLLEKGVLNCRQTEAVKEGISTGLNCKIKAEKASGHIDKLRTCYDIAVCYRLEIENRVELERIIRADDIKQIQKLKVSYNPVVKAKNGKKPKNPEKAFWVTFTICALILFLIYISVFNVLYKAIPLEAISSKWIWLGWINSLWFWVIVTVLPLVIFLLGIILEQRKKNVNLKIQIEKECWACVASATLALIIFMVIIAAVSVLGYFALD